MNQPSMRRVFTCRRTFTGLVGMCLLFLLDLVQNEPTGGYIVAVVACIAGSNAMQQTLGPRTGISAPKSNKD